MNVEDQRRVFGALTAQGFIMENLYALILSQAADPAAAARATANEMLRQFEDLPPNRAPGAPQLQSDEVAEIIQHGIHHLERFWVRVEHRLQPIQE